MTSGQAHLRTRPTTAGISTLVLLVTGLAPAARAGIQYFDAFRTGDFQQTTANPAFTPADASFWFFNARIFQTTAGDVGRRPSPIRDPAPR